MSTTALTADAAAVPGWRTLATRIVAALLAAVFGLLFFSLPLLVLSWASSGEDEIHAVHGIGWGVLAGLLLAVGLAAHAIAPRLVAPLQLAAAAVLALVVATALGDAGGLPQAAPFVLALGLLVFLSPARSAFADLAPRNRVLLAIAVVAAVPLLVYAWDQAGLSRSAAPTDPHVAEEDHYGSMAGMGIALFLGGVVAAAQRPGWRVALWCAGLGAVLFGLASLILGSAGAVTAVWGVVAVVGGIAFIVVGELDARRGSPSTPAAAGRDLR